MIPEKINRRWSAEGFRFYENNPGDQDCQRGDGSKQDHWINASHVVNEYVPYHAGQG